MTNYEPDFQDIQKVCAADSAYGRPSCFLFRLYPDISSFQLCGLYGRRMVWGPSYDMLMHCLPFSNTCTSAVLLPPDEDQLFPIYILVSRRDNIHVILRCSLYMAGTT